MPSILTEKREALEEAIAKFGGAVLQGKSLQERRAMQVAAVLTVLCTGSTKASSLCDTALKGGC